MIIIDDFGTHKVEIIPGNYTIDELSDALSSSLSSLNHDFMTDYRVRMSSTTGRTEITEESGKVSTFQLEFETVDRPDYFGLGYHLGFRKTKYSGKNHYTSEGLIDLASERYLLVQLGDITGHLYHRTHDGTLGRNIFTKVTLDGGSYSIIINQDHNQSQRVQFSSPISISRFDLRVYDPYGDLVDLNHVNWSCTIELEMVNSARTAHRYGSRS
jgi:hypothetical protein